MTSSVVPPVEETPSSGCRACPRAGALLQALMEAVVLVVVCAAPWCYGAVHPGFELLLFAGVGLVLALWGARMLLEGRLTWKKCPVAVCLAGLFLIGAWQTTPLSKPVLAWTSPGTSRLYDQLLPPQPEVVHGEENAASGGPAGRTISLYPLATRTHLVRLLAVFLVFGAVRNNLASEVGLWRLSVATLINGAALSLFALVQFFSSAPNVLYWRYPSLGTVFGPFICRNHFPFYVNLCIGLGVGLLLSRASRSQERGGPTGGRHRFASAPGGGQSAPRWTATLANLLHDPTTLWICAALALMVGAVAFSLSRGGFLALVGAAAVCLLLKRSQSVRSARGGAALVVAVLAVLLASWLGFGLIKDRLETLWKGEAFEGRLPLWRRTTPLVKDFPVWGTGYGTFSHVEALIQNSAEDAAGLYEHAHNDYLEVLIEGGLPGLALSLLAVGLVFRLGCRAIRLAEGRAAGGLALGALFGFTTLVIHSFGDFGIHIPAIALLATVLAAHLCGLGGGDGREPAQGGASAGGAGGRGEYRLRAGGLAPLLGAVTAVALGALLCGAGWRAHRVDRLRVAAFRAGETGGRDGLVRQVGRLDEAARLAPEDADLQAELGQARFKLREWETGRLGRRSEVAAVAEAVLAGRGDWATALAWPLAGAGQRELARAEQNRLERECLFPGLRNYLNARDRCPILSRPNLVLATYANRLARADSRDAYLGRVKRLAGGDPAAWYLCGAQELRANEPARAWESWRRCLELSDRYLPQILAASARELGPGELVEAVLPDRPEVLLAAARRLYPESGATAERRPFLEKAVRVLEGRPPPLRPEDLYVKAVAHKGLGQPAEAVAAYRQLLAKQPERVEWRYELAQVLYEEGQWEDARRELVLVLARQPKHAQARELSLIVSRELARKR